MPHKDPQARKEYKRMYHAKRKRSPEYYAQRKAYRQSEKGMRLKQASRLRKYGITLAQKEQMVTAQNGCCAICDKPLSGYKNSHVDHDHNTGKVRAILCNKCNLGIGHLNDSVYIVDRALTYLKKWGSGGS